MRFPALSKTVQKYLCIRPHRNLNPKQAPRLTRNSDAIVNVKQMYYTYDYCFSINLQHIALIRLLKSIIFTIQRHNDDKIQRSRQDNVILNVNENIPRNRNGLVFPTHSLTILKLQTVTQSLLAPCDFLGYLFSRKIIDFSP